MCWIACCLREASFAATAPEILQKQSSDFTLAMDLPYKLPSIGANKEKIVYVNKAKTGRLAKPLRIWGFFQPKDF